MPNLLNTTRLFQSVASDIQSLARITDRAAYSSVLDTYFSESRAQPLLYPIQALQRSGRNFSIYVRCQALTTIFSIEQLDLLNRCYYGAFISLHDVVNHNMWSITPNHMRPGDVEALADMRQVDPSVLWVAMVDAHTDLLAASGERLTFKRKIHRQEIEALPLP